MRIPTWITAAPILALVLAACSDGGTEGGTSGSPASQGPSIGGTSPSSTSNTSTSTLADASTTDGGGGSGQHNDAAADAAHPASGLMSACKSPGNPGDCGAGLQCFNFPSKGMFCTRACTKASEAVDCPQPPTGGCNNQNVCRPAG